MNVEGLAAVLDPEADGGWLRPRLWGEFGAVARTVPRGYDAYARILHPVDYSPWPHSGAPLRQTPTPVPVVTTWATVCHRTGRLPHALMQWRDITQPAPGSALPVSPEGRWQEVSTVVGSLEPPSRGHLLDVLSGATGDQRCYQGLWEGYGELHRDPEDRSGWFMSFSSTADGASVSSSQALPELPPLPGVVQRALAAPRLQLPGRDYLLFRGPLPATDQWLAGAPWSRRQSPNLMWPEDASWCVATEIDFDSTLVGGPTGLIEEVLDSPGLEAWPVEPDDDLSWLGDRINHQ